MKKQFLGLTLCTALFAAACNQDTKSSSGTNSNSDTTAYQKVSFYKSSTECGKDTCGGYVKASYPNFKDTKIQEFVNRIITNNVLTKENEKLEVLADSFINDYYKFKKDYPDSPGGYQWVQTLSVGQETTDLIPFTHTSYNYTGGAHGLQTILYYNYSKKANRALKLEDIIKSGQYPKLVQVAEEIFRTNEKLSSDQSLGDNYFFENGVFGLNDNFLITPKGLLFTYNPYEIKAYAFGTTDLLVPYDKIKDVIDQNSILADYVK